MRALLAIDGSRDSKRATELVRNLAWPSGSAMRVLSAYHVLPFYAGMPGVVLTPEVVEQTETACRGAAEAMVRSTVERLERPGLDVHGDVWMGQAAGAIIDAAQRFAADLVVVGSRGLGPFESSLMGSPQPPSSTTLPARCWSPGVTRSIASSSRPTAPNRRTARARCCEPGRSCGGVRCG